MGSICAGQGVISIIDPMKPRSSLSHKLEMSSPIFIETQESFYNFYLLHANPIGYGEHGEVWLCNKKSNNKLRAVKIVPKSVIPSSVIEDALIIKKFKKLKTIKSNVLIKIFQNFETRNDYFLITEHITEGDLYDLMNIHGRMMEQQAAKIIFQLLLAILKLQDSHQIFNDVKPENLLFTDKKNFLLKFNPVNLLNIIKDSSNNKLFLSPKALNGEFSKKCDS